MIRSIVLAALAATSMLAGCATAPHNIKAAAYAADQPCRDGDLARLAMISNEQSKKAQADVIGVLVVGLPVGSIGNKVDHKREIAEIKGRCKVA